MTEQELREKIARIIAKHLCKNRYSHFQLYGDSANCYSRENFAECEAIADTVDALIAAGIGDVSEWKDKATASELVAHAAANAAIARIEEWKYRTRLTERALFRACGSSQMMLVFLKQSEKELQEEIKKDQ